MPNSQYLSEKIYMSFYDDPVVDDNSKRSEESVNAVKSLFTRKNGFISREEIPDYGVDLDVELVTEEIGASSKKFAIQIKSTETVKSVSYNVGSLISLEFKTSRLGYLARRTPAYGIIVVYNESSQTSYFDYVEEIIKRLDELNSNEDWRNQKNVNILLPHNKLETGLLKDIHQKFITRHDNSKLLLQEHGHKFNIPFLENNENKPDGKFDFKDPIKVAEYLEKYGSFLFNENEFQMLMQMLGVLSKDIVNHSPQLIFLSAITFTQSGNVIEADYYLNKAKKLASKFTKEENGIIQFSQIRIEFLKGNMNYASFLEKFKELSSTSESLENQLTIEINILYFELMASIESDGLAADLKQKIYVLTKKIDLAEVPDAKKYLLKIYHSESQHTFAVQSFITYYHRFKVKESLGISVLLQERIAHARETISATMNAVKIVFEAYNFANDNELQLLKATAAQQLGKHFFSLRAALLLVGDEDTIPSDKEQLIKIYTTNQNYSLIAYNQFLQLNMFQNAHEALTTAYEIFQLCFYITQTAIGPLPGERLLAIAREIEEANDLSPFESAIEKVTATIAKAAQETKGRLLDKTDEEIDIMAKSVLNAYNLPVERLPNIIHDMKMYRTFEERCNNPNIILLQDTTHILSPETHYALLPVYILRLLTLKIQTKPSSDIEVLLNEFSSVLRR